MKDLGIESVNLISIKHDELHADGCWRSGHFWSEFKQISFKFTRL